LKKADTTYTELFSAPVNLGEKFSSADGSLKGTTWRDTDFTTPNTIQNAFTSFELQLPGYSPTIKNDKFQLKSDQWTYIVLGGTNAVKIILVKLYEPQKDVAAQ